MKTRNQWLINNIAGLWLVSACSAWSITQAYGATSDTINADLTLTPASAQANTLNTTVSFSQLGLVINDTKAVTATGQITLDLDIQNHPTRPSVAGISITGGQIVFADTTFTLVDGTLPLPVLVSTIDQSGTPDTVSPPGPVSPSDGVFTAEDHQIVLDSGEISVVMPLINQTVDLSDPANHVTITPTGLGLITLSPAGAPVGGSTPWDIVMSLPAVTTQPLFTDAQLALTISLSTTGTLEAAGRVNLPDLSGFAPGDATLDGRVEAADLNILAINWQGDTGAWADADFTGDGFVDAADLNLLAINWQAGVPAVVSADASSHALLEQNPAAPIPQPTSVLLLTGLFFLAGRDKSTK